MTSVLRRIEKGGRGISRLVRGTVARLRAKRYAIDSGSDNPLVVDIRSKLYHKWNSDRRGFIISETQRRLIGPDVRIFALGSCFAMEVRRVLRLRGIEVYPKYTEIDFDLRTQRIGDPTAPDGINHYDTFTIRQEFERAFAGTYASDDELWEMHSRSSNPFGTSSRFVDTNRMGVCGVDRQSTLAASRLMDDCIRVGVQTADMYIITLGLTECWRDRDTGRFVWGAGLMRKKNDERRLEFHRSTFQENYANMVRVCELVLDKYPDRKIVLTVSPVPLARTFSGNDIVVANTESKSLLRTVAGQLSRDFENVLYWPSFEIALKQDIFCEDGRHVSNEGAKFIVDNFLRAYAA